MDETNGWIFSEAAHDWMDNRRQHAADNGNCQVTGNILSFPRAGWEYGLFGFKTLHVSGRQYIVTWIESPNGMIDATDYNSYYKDEAKVFL
jgi:hypothetical protein